MKRVHHIFPYAVSLLRSAIIIIKYEGEIAMRKKEELKSVRTSVLMTEELSQNIKAEAKKRGIKANAVMVERLNHYTSDNTPAKMAEFQDYANEAVRLMSEYSEKDAKTLERMANKLWTF